MTFGSAIHALKDGMNVRRAGWKYYLYLDKDGRLRLDEYDAASFNNLEVGYIETADVLAEDWEVVK